MEKSKNLLIGIFFLTAIAIITYIILFLHPRVGDEGLTIKVRFANIDKVNIGTRVLFAGRPVGEVVSIEEVEGARSQGIIGDVEDVYIYELTLKVDSGVRLYLSDDIAIVTSGLLGEKSVEITPRPTPADGKLLPVGEQIMYASSPASLEEAVKEFTDVAESAKQAVDSIKDQIKILEENETAEHLSSMARNLSEITGAINRPEKINRFMDNMIAMADSASQMAHSGNVIVQDISNGKGSVGQLVESDDLYLRLVSVLNKAETVMDDVNHYGLLFHNDSSWQRLRARKMNLLARLSTPQEFYNYFNDEVNQISTSISRLSAVMEDCQAEAILPIITCEPFTAVFADLLRRVEALESDLKLFDQQVMQERENAWNPPYRCLN